MQVFPDDWEEVLTYDVSICNQNNSDWTRPVCRKTDNAFYIAYPVALGSARTYGVLILKLSSDLSSVVDSTTITYSDLGFTNNQILEKVSTLSDKGLIEVKVVKNDKNISEEVISLERFYNKLSVLMMEDVNVKRNSLDSSVFDFIQKEFSRTLGPVEIEIIKAWISDGNSDEIIKEAVKEAVFNGVYNLRYIDKILFEWGKKGIKSKEDVEKNRKNRRVLEEEEKEEEEFFDYNWFEDDE